MGGLIPAVRQATTNREVIKAIARRFGVISWAALSVQVVTGTWMILDRAWTGALILKIGLVLISAMLAAWHSIVAGTQSAAVRGSIQGSIIVLALVIVWVAIGL